MTDNLLTDLEAFAHKVVDDGTVPGCVVAAVDGDAAGTYSTGLSDLDPRTSWANDTIFGLDSVTKVFTAIMFAQAIEAGQIDENSFIDGYLPAGTSLPKVIQNTITLRMLANYTSQFPNQPSNYPREHGRRIPADYTIPEFQDYLEQLFHPNPLQIGTSYLYSSLAFGLLGYILANAHGLRGYEELVSALLTGPLGMLDTVAYPSPAQQPRVAIAYADGKPQPPLVTPPFLGGGGVLRSTGDDMLTFLRALTRREAPSTVVQAIERTEAKTFAINDSRGIGLGWFISEAGPPYFVKNGAGHGFYALIAYAPERGAGLFAAANTFVSGLFEREFASLLGAPHAVSSTP